MALNEQDYIIIDKALRNELSVSEQELFESRKADLEFKNEFELSLSIKNGIENAERQNIKDILKKEELKISSKSNSNNWLKIIMLVLILALLAFVGFKLLNQNNNEVDHNLYAANYQAYPNLIDPIVKGEQKNESVYQMYEQGNYKLALSAFQKMEKDEDVNWYICQCEIALKNFENAVSCLNNFRDKGSKYEFHIDWYLALVHLEQGHSAEAKKYLQKIIDENTRYAKRASSLLNSLS